MLPPPQLLISVSDGQYPNSIAKIMQYPIVLLELGASISYHICDLCLLLCCSGETSAALPFAHFPAAKRDVGAIPCLSAEVCGSWEGSRYRNPKEVFAESNFKCFSCGQIWKVFHKAQGTSLAERVTHLVKFQLLLPHVVRNLVFLWDPSSHYPRRSSWMSLDIFAYILHHFIPTQEKNFLSFLRNKKRTNGLTEISHHEFEGRM